MIRNAVSAGALVIVLGLCLAAAQDRPASKTSESAAAGGSNAASRPPNPDERAIGDLLGRFAKAYNARDARALGELFTTDAEIEDDEGDVTKGRGAIAARFDGMFKDGPSGTLGLTTDSLRFLTPDLAIEEGTASITSEKGTPPRTNRYSVIYARQGGRWLHARIRDEQPDEVSPHEQLRQLEWMLGEWVNESDDANVNTTCRWSDDGNYLLREFDVKAEGRITLRGTQRIGWDGQRKQFRTWIFDDRGGFAEGLMSREGDRWLIKSTGVRPDGRAVSGTSAITMLGKDHLRWETFDRTLGGETIPQADHFDLVRRPPGPGK